MGEDDQTFSYTSNEQLKLLVALLAESSIELSVHMMAVVPEEFRKLRDRICSLRGTGNRKDEEESKPLLEKIIEQAKEHRVLPFTSLKCDFAIYGRAQIESAYGFRRIEDNPFIGGEHPLAFVEGWRVYGINMTDARKERDIRVIKETAISIPSDKYTITSIRAGLNPCDYTSDHYFDGTDYDGYLWAGDGTITLTGAAKVKGGFDKMLKKLAEMGIKPVQKLPEGHIALPAPRT